MELSRQMCAEAGLAAAQELRTHVEHIVMLERSDAQVARDVNTARTDAEVARVLRRAQETQPVQAVQHVPVSPATWSAAASNIAASSTDAPSVAASSPASTAALGATSSSAAASRMEPMPEPGPNRSKRLQCISCYERKESFELSCKHAMCRGCLGQLLMKATGDLTLWPPRCCRLPIDLALAQQVLRLDERIVFIARMQEANAKNKMYCTNPWCSHFLNLDVIGMEEGHC